MLLVIAFLKDNFATVSLRIRDTCEFLYRLLHAHVHTEQGSRDRWSVSTATAVLGSCFECILSQLCLGDLLINCSETHVETKQTCFSRHQCLFGFNISPFLDLQLFYLLDNVLWSLVGPLASLERVGCVSTHGIVDRLSHRVNSN
jgi:hypothetical protein